MTPQRASRVVGWLNATFRHWSLLPAVLLFAVLTAYPVLNLLRMSVSTITFKGDADIWRSRRGTTWTRSSPIRRWSRRLSTR